MAEGTIVGVISDTHGLLRPEAVEALAGSDVIFHAGDVGRPDILERLAETAPVHAVRGNTDHGAWAEGLPETEVVTVEGTHIYMLHDVDRLDLDPRASDLDAVVYGHSHRPEISRRDDVLFFNPGAAGHRRFTLPVTVGRLRVAEDGALKPEIIHLEVDG